jgi:hypothetical protein
VLLVQHVKPSAPKGQIPRTHYLCAQTQVLAIYPVQRFISH